jgi:tetratricopeptide (TPR) repeat protein
VLAGSAVSQRRLDFESLLASAQQAQASGDFEKASESYREAVSLEPQIAELQANLGLMYYQTGKDQQAIVAFSEAIRLKPDLFVPNLFLGLGFLKLKRFDESVPYLKRAALINPTDPESYLALGRAYTATGRTRLAVDEYARAVRADSRIADSWYKLGIAYLEQVEADARILLARHKDSGYFHALVGDTFAEQGAFIQAEEAYKAALNSRSFPSGTHVAYAFVLLCHHDLQPAESELHAELVSSPDSLLPRLGLARLSLENGATVEAVKRIEAIWKSDAAYLRSNAALFKTGLAPAKRSELQDLLDRRVAAGDLPSEISAWFAVPAKSQGIDLAKLHMTGTPGECRGILASPPRYLETRSLQAFASCAYSSGDYRRVSDAAAKLVSNRATEAEGLYWETKSAQSLATEALTRASETDSDSPKMHILLGDIYRQQKSFPEAQMEYRKALALRPEDTGALLGVSLAFLADGQNDEALTIAQAALARNPADPELNAVMGEILCARDDFPGAEPYLHKSLNAKPEFVPRVHALLGKVYAQTNRTQQAVAELKLALPTDKDGSLHYQIARLYLKVGERVLAMQAFEVAKKLEQEGLMHAAVAMEQGRIQSESQ